MPATFHRVAYRQAPASVHHGLVTSVMDEPVGTAAATPLDEPAGLDELADLVARGGVLVLSGAGLSTESGIPDYRGPTGRLRTATPMTYQVFTGDATARRRYWARSQLGWRHVTGAAPNAGHRAVAELESRGPVAATITQNVDGLHQAAGAQRVVELHGGLARVRCLTCNARTSRAELDRRLRAANRHWNAEAAGINPDGDADLTDAQVRGFRVVDCTSCGGILKPDVIFFGENVPAARVADSHALVDRASALLILGSSLAVMSGYRFVRHAAARAIPIALINQGETRADPLATITIHAPLGPTLTALLHRSRQAGRSATTTVRRPHPYPARSPDATGPCIPPAAGGRPGDRPVQHPHRHS